MSAVLALLLLLSGGLTLCSNGALVETESVQYTLEDFQTFVPWVWQGRPFAIGTVNVVPSDQPGGKKLIRATWDLSKVDDGFVVFGLGRPLVGNVQRVKVRVFVSRETVGRTVRLTLEDKSGETYVSDAKLDHAGWSEIVFPVAGLGPAWPSGDKNRVQDLPLRLIGLGSTEPRTTGELLLDKIVVETCGEPRELVYCAMVGGDDAAFIWNSRDGWTLRVQNPASTSVRHLLVSLSAVDALTGKVVWEQQIPIRKIKSGGSRTIKALFPNRRGAFDLKWSVADSRGVLPSGTGQERVARLFARASELPAGSAERHYVQRWGLVGGVLAYATPKRAAELGATWSRQPVYWWDLEQKPGRFDLAKAAETLRNLQSQSMDLLYFDALYDRPAFRSPDHLTFAPAYGRLYRELARLWGPAVRWYEFGNEDNGPTKFIYTEIARHAAAAVRAERPDAILGNSGTAMVDTGWLRLQAARGLFDRLDALVTHPYTANSAPEQFGVLEQLASVDELIDELGGMKEQLTTEFGYPLELEESKRAPWIVRQFAIGAAAGLMRHGLYTWDGHFGLCDSHRPRPAAVAVNAFACLTRGHEFAGWLQRDHQVWAAVFERAGKPLVMAWSPAESGTLELQVTTKSAVQAFDMMGNPWSPPVEHHRATLKLTGDPVYLRGLPANLIQTAWQASAQAAAQRFSRLLRSSPLKDHQPWAALAADEAPSAEALSQALMNWQPLATPISSTEQAVIAQAVRCLEVAAKLASFGKTEKATTSRPDWSAARERWSAILTASVKQDVDLPAVRWLANRWDRMRDLAAVARERRNPRLAAALTRTEPVFDKLYQVFAEDGPHVFFPIWPYLYRTGGETQSLVETLQFVPGKATPVQARLYSYATHPYEAILRLDLPRGWRCEPAQWRGEVEPQTSVETHFLVTAGAERTDHITAILSVAGKPEVRVPFDDYQILPPLDVAVPVLHSPLPGSPLPVEVINRSDHAESVTLRVTSGKGLPALARLDVGNLGAGESRTVEAQLPDRLGAPLYNEWQLLAQLRTSRNEVSWTPLTVDFDAAKHVATPPVIDGNLADWSTALPLHTDKQAYTRGSFGSGWSPEDLSGKVFTMWDDKYFYFAARVNDQLFHQELEGGAVWNQDSVQIIFAPEQGDQWTEFCLALTPKGPQVWKTLDGFAKGATLAVTQKPGLIVYECAIPWADMDGIRPRPGGKCRFDVLFNDDDAIVPRRVMERYGIGIVHTKNPKDFGWLRFLGVGASLASTSAPTATARPERILFEDFEEYPEGALPDQWHAATHRGPVPRATVRDGVGRNSSKALVLDNPTGAKPYVYLVLTRELSDLQAGHTYQLSAWVKGEEIAAPTTMLGVCSDRFANESTHYMDGWIPAKNWQQIQTRFIAPGGSLKVLIRNADKMHNFIIDDIQVAPVPDKNLSVVGN